jgi:NAD(P)-dependent dehydrogenase (short-subunit alcohol dehydrogenase family)
LRTQRGTIDRVAVIDSRSVPEPVSIVGGTGALGFGLALRFGRAGVPIVIGPRDPSHAEQAATVPLAAAMAGKATRTLGVWQGSAEQQSRHQDHGL